ncbi:universal stress protein [Streptomyces sp. NPDC005141]
MAQPIAVDHDPGHERLRPVVLGIDARRPRDAVTGFAFDAALRRGAPLHAVHAWHLPAPSGPSLPVAPPEADRGAWEDEEVQLLADALRPWREKYPRVRVYEDVRLQSPATALVHSSDAAGLVVVGRGGAALGPTLKAVLSHARCPVTVVPY